MRWMFLLALAACPHPRAAEPPDPARPTPPDAAPGDEPTLEVEVPARGTFVDAGTVVVRGRVHDDGVVKVTINNTPATVAPDGSFLAEVAVPRGLTILETHAIDTAGHDVRDVRAVLGGPFAASDGRATASIGVRLGRGGVAALGKTLAASAKAIDFAQAAQALNPVYDEGSCLGARVDISSVTVGAIDVALAPRANAIETVVQVDNVEVKLDVRYRVACMSGTTSMSVRTRARVAGELRARLDGKRLRTALPTPDVTLDDFVLELRGVPGPVASLLRRVVRPAVEIALARAIESKLPPIADARLAELLTRPPLPQVLGRDVDVIVSPQRIDVTPTGFGLVAESSLVVRGGETGRYSTIKSLVPASAADASVWVAADAVNQLLAGLWAAHAFDRTLPRDRIGALAMLLDERVASVELAILLPPTIHANATLELAVGDLVITARDAAGAEVQRFAVSLRTGLAIKPGELTLGTTEPTVYAQLIAQHGTLTRPLDGPAVEGIVKGAWSLVAGNIDAALQLPIPGLASGAHVQSLTAREGAIVLDLVVR